MITYTTEMKKCPKCEKIRPINNVPMKVVDGELIEVSVANPPRKQKCQACGHEF